MAELAETDHIERDLAQTRARMDRRLDELGDHLTPRQMVNDAFAYFKGGDGADFTQDVIGNVKANPLPVVLTGIGIAWLMASSNRPASTVRTTTVLDHPSIAVRLRSAEAGVVRAPEEHADDHASRLDEARGKVLGIAKGASDTASDYAQRIKDAIISATQSARETGHDLSANASSATSALSGHAQRSGEALTQGIGTMAQSTRDTVASVSANPFALGAIAAFVGLVAGALIPATEQEERALGATADKLRTTGRDLAQDVVDRGGQVASDVLGAAKDSAGAHGLTADKPVGEAASDLKSGALIDTVKQVASETLEAGKDSAQTRFASAPEGSGSGDTPRNDG
jgi:ElaB/YqjD/DUF883 family membrane-anchored ribosome-binding protein